MDSATRLGPGRRWLEAWVLLFSCSVAWSQAPQLPVAPLGKNPQRASDLEGLYERRDARADNWTVEQIERDVHAVLETWELGLGKGSSIGGLREGQAVEVFGRLPQASGARAGLSVTRDEAMEKGVLSDVRGALQLALGLPADHGLWRIKFKTTAAREEEGRWVTEHRVEGLGKQEGEPREIHARWRCEWIPPSGETEAPQIRAIGVSEHAVASAARTLFEEITGSIFDGVASFDEQLGPDLEHWASRVDRGLGMTLIGHEGVAIRDVNGDGLEDLYLPQPGGLPNRLYLKQSDGTVRDASAESGLDFLDPSRSALFCDFDGDGDADVAVELDPKLAIFENDGAGHFRERARFDLGSTTSLAVADVDADGDLDLYACGYILPDEAHVAPVPYHDADNGRPNTLLRNDISEAGWSFSDVTAEVGLDENNRRFSFAACFEDVDDDGDPDLYVSNDFGRNNLYINEEGRFRDRAAEAGVEDVAAGMGVSFADVDRDGDFDLHVSNMFSSAGGRVVGDERFGADRSEEAVRAYERHARGNTLFLARGDGTYEDASLAAGISLGRWAWGAIFCELDNDGWPDLFVPNGFVTGQDPDDL